jgi:hypothetical protein
MREKIEPDTNFCSKCLFAMLAGQKNYVSIKRVPAGMAASLLNFDYFSSPGRQNSQKFSIRLERSGYVYSKISNN